MARSVSPADEHARKCFNTCGKTLHVIHSFSLRRELYFAIVAPITRKATEIVREREREREIK